MKQLQQLIGRTSSGFRRSTLLLMALIFALTSIALQPAAQAQQQIGGSSGPLSPSSAVVLGLDTGAFYDAYNQTLNGNAEQVLNEYKYLGVQWIRIEANRIPENRRWIYRRLVELAHARGIRVIVDFAISSPYTNDDDQASRDALINSVIGDPRGGTPSHDSLHYYATNIFGIGYEVRPDGYEIGNEPNFCKDDRNLNCSDGQRFQIGGRTFAWLLRRAWDWKQYYSRSDLIISGGILNANLNELWWVRFLGETNAWNGPRPYDYFGIHPYQGSDIDTQNCINHGLNTCFGPWENTTTTKLTNLKARMDSVTHDPNTRFFATEAGWEYLQGRTVCPDQRNCVTTEQQLRDGMQAALNAASRSNAVDLLIFHNYRDDPPGSRNDLRYFGLRSNWDGQRWPAKASWDKFRLLAGGSGTTSEQAWVPVTCPTPPPGRNPLPGPCRARFYDSNLQSFDYYIEDQAQKGVIEGTPIEGGSPYYTWTINPEQPVSRAVFVSWIVRARNWAFVNTTGVQHFTDVPPANRYFTYIETAYAQNPRPFDGYVCNGSDVELNSPNATCFRPDNTLTRGQASKIITLSWNWLEPVSGQTFEDVPPGSTFYDYIERMARRGLVGGYSCGGLGEPCNPPYNRPYFRPNNTLTRGQTIKIISNAIVYGQLGND